jgi:hypothetical protein
MSHLLIKNARNTKPVQPLRVSYMVEPVVASWQLPEQPVATTTSALTLSLNTAAKATAAAAGQCAQHFHLQRQQQHLDDPPTMCERSGKQQTTNCSNVY